MPARQAAGTKPKPQGEWPPKLEETPASPHADLANAHRLVKHKGAGLAYVSTMGWLYWRKTGPWKRGELEARKAAFCLGRIIAKESTELSKKAGDIEDEAARKDAMRQAEDRMKWARASESRKSVLSALSMAEPLLAVDSEKVDADPLLLGCPNGTLDLQTGILRPHDPSDWITMTTRAHFDPRAQAPTWARFVREIMCGDQELVDWLQAFCGLCLTGLTTEHLLVVAWGNGSNGKSTFIGALEHVFGDYAKPAGPGLLMKKRNEGHPTERMDLRGARLVIASESDEGERLAEDKVKALTGGDTIKGRWMKKDLEAFPPTHKLFLQTNHRPPVSGTDNGIWRRVKLVPFAATFSEEAKDLQMPEKLKAEAPGILRWCMEGLQKYLRAGRFPPCKAIELASKQYREECDLLGQFIGEECTTGPGFRATSRELYEAFRAWAADNGAVHIWTKKTFGMRMSERGFTEHRSNTARGWEGLYVNAEAPPTPRKSYGSRSG